MVEGKQEQAFFPRKLRMGMVGGGRDAFIGGVHRRAAMFDGGVELVAGAFSSTPEKALASGRDLLLPEDRIYGSWQEMLEKESAMPEDKRLDFVSIVTPNFMHYPIGKAFAAAGFNVVSDKLMVMDMDQAEDLLKTVRESGVIYAVTYNYAGYPMVKQAKYLVESGQLGRLQKVVVEYPQGWLVDRLELTGQKQAAWRVDPVRCGVGGSIGDLGSHCENLMSYITGLELEAVCADLSSSFDERPLDDDADVLLRFTNGAKGILYSSQISTGEENNLVIRVYGTKAGLEWHQENPNYLHVRDNDGPERIYKRGNGYNCEAAAEATRTPTGHTEGYYEAFANVYKNITDTIRCRIMGTEPTELMLDFADVIEGARTVFFVHKVVESGASDGKWTPARFPLS